MSASLQKIKATAYAYLARREHSSQQIELKLNKKGFDPLEIETVLQALTREGSLSDQRYLESYLRYRKGQGYGPLRIKQELLLAGLSKDLIEDQLNITDNAWLDEMKRVWQKRFRAQLPSDMKEKAKQLRFLQYRGFTPEQIRNLYDFDDDA